jgi:flagellar protein FlbD
VRRTVIRVTRLNRRPFVVNSELIKFLEETPDTVITLINNEKIVVSESIDDILDRVVEYGRRLRAFAVE